MNPEPTVFLVSAAPLAGRELRHLLAPLDLRVEVFDSPASFLRAYDPDRAGCLLLDLRSPWPHAAPADAPGLLALQIETPVVFLTGARDEPLGVRPSHAAAEGNVVSFRGDPPEPSGLLDAIEWAIAGDSHARSERSRGAEIAKRLRSLTRREQEVMALVVNGMSNRRIADHFGISARTVEIHRARVMEKMGAGSLSELVRMACVRGIQSGPHLPRDGAPVHRVTPDAGRRRKGEA